MPPRPRPLLRRLAVLGAGTAVAASAILAGTSFTAPVLAARPTFGAPAGCALGRGGTIRHVIYVQFDNTHLLRDLPSVPSDLEQMPHLLNFIQNNGTLLTNDHTVLISHTAGGILSSLTGVYPDRHGQTVSNSYVRTSTTGGFSFPSSFGYWTDPVVGPDTPTVPNMVTPDGKTAPAPWVPFTRAGCDFGAVATANTVLENTGYRPDRRHHQGVRQPLTAVTRQAAVSNCRSVRHGGPGTRPDRFRRASRSTAPQDSPTCATGQYDLLPDEPGGYAGFKGLFGAQEIDPLLTGQPATVAVTDLAASRSPIRSASPASRASTACRPPHPSPTSPRCRRRACR